ncbi:MAG: hypothetical protein L6Q97_02165, partial [Thermoanaerobaculia bacterium]|nr:hypothetical protein [Thermoanaerobaculia bacterium]
YAHDGYVNNDMLYSAHIYAGQFAIINMANKTNPTLLGTQTTPGAFTHNTWLSGNTLFTTDEVSNSYLATYNVSNPNNITMLDRIQITPGSGSIVHNTHVLDNYAVTSWYICHHRRQPPGQPGESRLVRHLSGRFGKRL